MKCSSRRAFWFCLYKPLFLWNVHLAVLLGFVCISLGVSGCSTHFRLSFAPHRISSNALLFSAAIFLCRMRHTESPNPGGVPKAGMVINRKFKLIQMPQPPPLLSFLYRHGLFLFCALEESHFLHEDGALFYPCLPIYPQVSALGRVGPQERNAQWRDELINIESGLCYHFSEVKSFLCIIGLHLRITAWIGKKPTTFN